MTKRRQALFCLLAGGGDAATGLLLVAAPALVLRLLGLERPADLTLLRFVGVFVTCVGLAYCLPWLRHPWLRRRVQRQPRLLAMLEMTAGVRLAVALFLGIAVASSALELPWLEVGFYDAVVALAQIWWLASGGFGDEI